MELKNIVSFTITKDKNIYQLHLPLGASHGEVYDVLFEMLNFVAKEAQEAVQRASSQAPQTQVTGDQPSSTCQGASCAN